MNVIDLVILGVLAVFAVKGLIRGVIMEVFTLIGLLIGYLIALREMSVVAGFLEKWLHLKPPVPGIVGFILIFLLIVIVFRLIAGLLRKFVKWTFLGWLDRGLGTLLGLFKGILISSLLIMLVGLVPPSDSMEKTQEESLLFGPVKSVAPAVFNVIKHTFPKTKDFYEEVKEGVSESSDKVKQDIIRRQLKSMQEDSASHVPRD